MGTVVRFFRSTDKMNLNETTDVMVSILNELGYTYGYNTKYSEFEGCYCNYFGTLSSELISGDGDPEGLCFYVYDKYTLNLECEFNIIGKEMETVIYWEDVGKGDVSFLEIAYRYFQRYPYDLFWTDDVIYTKDDIEKIYHHKEINGLWCYRKPDYLL